ncbi:MAG: RHS repeat-associated core domain-containing protein, partial [Calditrichia bacterium]
MASEPYRAEYDGGGKLLAEYVYANGQRIAKMNAGGDVDYYLNDHLGSARAMAGSKWSANYYPFGEIASQGGSQEDTRYDFTGKERDRSTGLHYFGARYYDSEIGRFLSVDAFADKYPSMTPYHYAA